MPEDATEHYFLQKLGSGQAFSTNSYKYTKADRDLIDRLLFLGAEGHRHTGDSSIAQTIQDAPLLSISRTGGTLPAGSRLRYKVTLVDTSGFESAASPEARIDTASSVASPFQPTNPVVSPTGGSLQPGNYYYVLSAWTDFDNQETAADNALYVSVPFSTATNKVTLDLPPLPGGATGFNVYRRTPSGSGYLHVDVIDMSGATPPTQFVDDGTLTEDCDRFAPTVSTALSRNSVVVTLPIDPVPPGYAWRIYRALNAGDYTNSLVTTITDGTRTFVDTGSSTLPSQPPIAGIAPGSPEKVLLTDGAEVRGRLPLSAVSAYPQSQTFSYPGPVAPTTGTTRWVCPFPQATIVGVQACLGKGSYTNADPVIVNVQHWRPATGTETPVFTVPQRPTIPASLQVFSPMTAPDSITEILAGDVFTVDIDQGAGANAKDLTVTIYLLVYGYTVAVSHPWAV